MRRWWLAGPAGGVIAVLAGGCGLLLGVHVETVLLALAAVLGAGLAVASGMRAVRHARLARELARLSKPGHLADAPVRSVSGVGPVVVGLVRPVVYCGDDVADRLTPSQQQAVLLHERCHQRRRDPVRLVILDAIDTLLGRLRPVHRRVETARARLEIRADCYALDRGATRPDLAAALLTLSTTRRAGAAAFATVTQQRLTALLDGAPPPRQGRHWAAITALGIATVGTVSACLPVLSASHTEIMFAARCLAGGCGVGG